MKYRLVGEMNPNVLKSESRRKLRISSCTWCANYKPMKRAKQRSSHDVFVLLKWEATILEVSGLPDVFVYLQLDVTTI